MKVKVFLMRKIDGYYSNEDTAFVLAQTACDSFEIDPEKLQYLEEWITLKNKELSQKKDYYSQYVYVADVKDKFLEEISKPEILAELNKSIKIQEEKALLKKKEKVAILNEQLEKLKKELESNTDDPSEY